MIGLLEGERGTGISLEMAAAEVFSVRGILHLECFYALVYSCLYQ